VLASAVQKPSRDDERWRRALLGTNPFMRTGHSFFSALPSPPRCELCATPFKGPLATMLGLVGKRPFPKNPRYCSFCVNGVLSKKVGAEVEMSALFADVRGSTSMAERLGPTGLHQAMDSFYRTGVETLVKGGAILDRFMGDQVVGYFVPGFAGPEHTRRAIETGLALLRATGHARGMPWIPVGAGVHMGSAFIGTVGGTEGLYELTALGEDVNIAARLAALAGPGELLCTEAAYVAARLDLPGDIRHLTLKGVSGHISAHVLHASA
jgi:adenylate cyclase